MKNIEYNIYDNVFEKIWSTLIDFPDSILLCKIRWDFWDYNNFKMTDGIYDYTPEVWPFNKVGQETKKNIINQIKSQL